MALQLNTAQRILIINLLKEGFEAKLIVTEASRSVRTVQRIRLKMDSGPKCYPKTNRVGRRGCITPLMQKPWDILIAQPYMYRCAMADFLCRRFRKRISDRLCDE
jgi:hypothetical protein